MEQNKALLVVSFGTSHHDTREKTIDQIEAYLGQSFPDRKVYRAWTSGMIIQKLRRELPGMTQFTPHLYPNRADNEAYINLEIDLRPLDAYLAKKNAGRAPA